VTIINTAWEAFAWGASDQVRRYRRNMPDSMPPRLLVPRGVFRSLGIDPADSHFLIVDGHPVPLSCVGGWLVSVAPATGFEEPAEQPTTELLP